LQQQLGIGLFLWTRAKLLKKTTQRISLITHNTTGQSFFWARYF